MIPRLTAPERKAFVAPPKRDSRGRMYDTGRPEPALGSLETRLSILCQRLGAPKAVRLTAQERAELDSYQEEMPMVA